jgi:hypothetical protein
MNQNLNSAVQRLFAEKITNFPGDGDNKKISLSNSKYSQPSYAYAKNLKENFPKIWGSGGNGGEGEDKTSFTGNDAFSMWTKYRGGDRSEAVLNWVKRRERFMNRHAGNGKSVASVISWLKWGAIGDIGWSKAKAIIEEAKKKSKD